MIDRIGNFVIFKASGISYKKIFSQEDVSYIVWYSIVWPYVGRGFECQYYKNGAEEMLWIITYNSHFFVCVSLLLSSFMCDYHWAKIGG